MDLSTWSGPKLKKKIHRTIFKILCGGRLRVDCTNSNHGYENLRYRGLCSRLVATKPWIYSANWPSAPDLHTHVDGALVG